MAKANGKLKASNGSPKKFNGVVKLDVRDSKADWPAFLDQKAPEGAPNILVILYDDTGCAAWSPYGGRINMPTLDKLAKNGLTYTQWHTTAVCSPTRSCFSQDVIIITMVSELSQKLPPVFLAITVTYH